MTSIAFQISSEAPLKVNQNNIQNMYKPERIKSSWDFLDAGMSSEKL